jgi:hypothetical protein
MFSAPLDHLAVAISDQVVTTRELPSNNNETWQCKTSNIRREHPMFYPIVSMYLINMLHVYPYMSMYASLIIHP